MRNLLKAVVTIAISVGFVYVSQCVYEDCERRVCPGGARARVVQRQGCVCIGRSR